MMVQFVLVLLGGVKLDVVSVPDLLWMWLNFPEFLQCISIRFFPTLLSLVFSFPSVIEAPMSAMMMFGWDDCSILLAV